MFLKSLLIENGKTIIRNISFKKGLNLIIDETKSDNNKETGNSIGKTTVIRLIDFCLDGDGTNIYKDPEFKNNNAKIEMFLKGDDNDVTITLTLKENLDDPKSREITIKRNFKARTKKIQQINNTSYSNTDFEAQLKKQIFGYTELKPTFKQIISKNIRDEKNRLTNTVLVLDAYTKKEEYEALYLFWLGIGVPDLGKKQELLDKIKIEERIQGRLTEGTSLSEIEQKLIILKRDIKDLETKKKLAKDNANYDVDFSKINNVKAEINRMTTLVSTLELRRDLIQESRSELEEEKVEINVAQVKTIYEEAKALIPNLQKTFADTLKFHNDMVAQKLKYITKELPNIETEINAKNTKLKELLQEEDALTEKLTKVITSENLDQIIVDLNKLYEQKGSLEEQDKQWKKSNEALTSLNEDLATINNLINDKDPIIKERIAKFNEYFSKLSQDLYGEQFLLSDARNDKGYGLNISTVSGNPGTGKKKGQIAAFDLAYIQFAEFFDIKCLHFIIHDQVENIDDNQLSTILLSIINKVNCQYILPVLRDKLPQQVDPDMHKIISLSQSDKLFKIP